MPPIPRAGSASMLLPGESHFPDTQPEVLINTTPLGDVLPGAVLSGVQHTRADVLTLSNIRAFLDWCGQLYGEGKDFVAEFAPMCFIGSNPSCFLGAVALYGKGAFPEGFKLSPEQPDGEHWSYALARHGKDWPEAFEQPNNLITLADRFKALEQAGFCFHSTTAHLDYSPRTAAIYNSNLDAIKAMQAVRPETLNGIESGKHALHLAAAAGSAEILEFLLAQPGANPNIACELTGETPLHCAARAGWSECVALLKRTPGINLNSQRVSGDPALSLAAKYGQIEVLDVLLTKPGGADVELLNHEGLTALQIAARVGQTGSVAKLLEKGASKEARSPNGLTPLHYAAGFGHVGVVEKLTEKSANLEASDRQGHTPLHFAASSGHVGVVEKLIGKGADTEASDQGGHTPLHFAASSGHVGVVEKLIGKGADKGASDAQGATPLHLAALSGRVGVVEKLLANGANIEAPDRSGATPLHFAAFGGCVGAVEKLLENGANIEAPNRSGATPLHIAASHGHLGAVEKLLEHGANINAINLPSLTPLHLAARGGHLEVVEKLLEKGANKDVSVMGNPLTTALAWAVGARRAEVVRTLLAAQPRYNPGILESIKHAVGDIDNLLEDALRGRPRARHG